MSPGRSVFLIHVVNRDFFCTTFSLYPESENEPIILHVIELVLLKLKPSDTNTGLFRQWTFPGYYDHLKMIFQPHLTESSVTADLFPSSLHQNFLHPTHLSEHAPLPFSTRLQFTLIAEDARVLCYLCAVLLMYPCVWCVLEWTISNITTSKTQ